MIGHSGDMARSFPRFTFQDDTNVVMFCLFVYLWKSGVGYGPRSIHLRMV